MLATKNINLPGYHYEEGIEISQALDFINKDSGSGRVGYSFKLFEREIPYMMYRHSSSLQSFIVMPFLAVFKNYETASRYCGIFLSIIAIILTGLICRKIFNERIALIASVFFALSSNTVLWSRVGLLRFSFLLVIAALAVYYFFADWVISKRKSSLYLGILLCGFGIYLRLNFVIIFLALLTVYYLIIRAVKKISKKDRILCSLLFLVGLLPLVIFNIFFRLTTFKVMLNSVFSMTPEGINNMNLVYSFLVRIKHLISIISGSAYDMAGNIIINPVIFVIYGLIYIYLFWELFLKENNKVEEKSDKIFIKSLLIIQPIIFTGTMFTISNFINLHLMILLPLPYITAAVFIDRFLKTKNIKKIIAVHTIAVLMIFSELSGSYSVLKDLNKTGGNGCWSDAIYELSDYLSDNNITTPVAIDWGIKYNVETITKSKVKVLEAIADFVTPVEEDFNSKVNMLLSSGHQYFIVLAEENTKSTQHMALRNLFFKVIKRTGKKISLTKEFYSRKGSSEYLLYSVN